MCACACVFVCVCESVCVCQCVCVSVCVQVYVCVCFSRIFGFLLTAERHQHVHLALRPLLQGHHLFLSLSLSSLMHTHAHTHQTHPRPFRWRRSRGRTSPRAALRSRTRRCACLWGVACEFCRDGDVFFGHVLIARSVTCSFHRTRQIEVGGAIKQDAIIRHTSELESQVSILFLFVSPWLGFPCCSSCNRLFSSCCVA